MTPELAQLYRHRSVVVTGSNGYLGSALTAALRECGASVRPVQRPRADVRTIGCWIDIVAHAEIVFHLAGNTSVEDADADPEDSLRSTVQPIVHLADAARAANRRPRVVFASTATIYGLANPLPVDEGSEPAPVTTYDRHKLLAERQLASATCQEAVDGVSLRLTNVYGPSPSNSTGRDRGILNRMARRAVAGEELCLFGDGNYLRDYVYVGDVVRAFLIAGVRPRAYGVFNVASGTGTTVGDAFQLVAERAERRTGRRSPIRAVAWPAAADRIGSRQFIANIGRMAATFGWRPAVSLSEGIDLLIEDLCEDRL